jgi:hypothetical protein
MGRKLLLIDYENIRTFDLTRLAGDVDVVIFVGAGQKNVPFALTKAAHKLGSRLEWHEIEGSGHNALDFHIACHLGRVFEKARGLECYVLSHDGGFDPLLKYLSKNGLKCSRIANLSEIVAGPTSPEEANYKLVVDLLRKSAKSGRPRKRATLIRYIASMFPKQQPSPVEIDAIITHLKANKLLSERDGTISYG